jgi:hypothetical protein
LTHVIVSLRFAGKGTGNIPDCRMCDISLFGAPYDAFAAVSYGETVPHKTVNVVVVYVAWKSFHSCCELELDVDYPRLRFGLVSVVVDPPAEPKGHHRHQRG